MKYVRYYYALHFKIWRAMWTLEHFVKKADSDLVCGACASVPAILLVLGMALRTAKALNV